MKANRKHVLGYFPYEMARRLQKILAEIQWHIITTLIETKDGYLLDYDYESLSKEDNAYLGAFVWGYAWGDGTSFRDIKTVEESAPCPSNNLV